MMLLLGELTLKPGMGKYNIHGATKARKTGLESWEIAARISLCRAEYNDDTVWLGHVSQLYHVPERGMNVHL